MTKKKFLRLGILVGIIIVFPNQAAFGHGLSAETFTAMEFDGRQLELGAILIPNPEIEGKQIGIELYDKDTKIPAPGTTYYLKVTKNDQIIFEQVFKRNYTGLIIDLIPTKSGDIILEETKNVSPIETQLGVKSKMLAKGPVFNEGGLYFFEVKILTIGSFDNTLKTPLHYKFGLSFPDVKYLDVENSDSEIRQLEIISYFDQIGNVHYSSESTELSFDMPFEWSPTYINQVQVVHEEIKFPKNFEKLMSSEYQVSVNGIQIPEDSITVDDFSIEEVRIIHVILSKNQVFEFYKENKDQKNMSFLMAPKYLQTKIPEWVKNSAGWWAQGQIMDSDFLMGIQFMINEKIIKIPNISNSVDSSGIEKIPEWVKNNAGWWAQGLINERDFVSGIEYLVNAGIIKVKL